MIPFCRRKIIRNHLEKDQPYLIRYTLFRSRLFSIYIHRFMSSDSGDHHDHPWNFFTYILEGKYTEERLAADPNGKGELRITKTVRKTGSLAYRKALDTHKVFLDRAYRSDEEHLAPLTLCIIFRRHRIWGFIKRTATGYEWVNWLDYLEFDGNLKRFYGSDQR